METIAKKPHSFDSPQTKTLLEDHKLNNLPPDALRTLFKKMLNEKIVKHASTASGPESCKFYNKGVCKNGDKCQFLHVCEHYVEGDCTFGDSKCKRLHNFDTSHSRKVLAHHGLGHLRNDRQILLVLRNGPQKPSLSRSDSCEDNLASFLQSLISLSTGERRPPSQAGLSPPSATSEDDKKEICGFYLRGKCNYGTKCHARHTSLPYEWQYCVNGMNPSGWVSFAPSENCKIEKAFCNYEESSGKAKSSEARFTIDFQTMTGKMEQRRDHKCAVLVTIRRLSTVSSVNAATGHVFRTRWKWYWKDEHDNWQSYDDGKAETSSDKIEQEYQSETGERKHKFSNASNKYTLYFDDATKLYQQNHKYGTKRDVRRRPAQFLDEEAMKQMLEEFKRTRQRTSSSSSDTASSIPSHWTPVDTSEEFNLADLSEVLHHEEFIKVKTQFLAAMPDYTVKSIKRVQNPGLWEDYERQKSKITKKNSGNLPKEQWLFHGTNKDIVDPICQQGFDWRLSGSKHGARYGKGSYFATDPSYSHTYSAHSGTGVMTRLRLSNVSKTETFRMFLAKVIVGSSTVGSYGTQRPPSKDSSDPLSPLYDSCVNNVNDPTIFVVFERSQAYPYYIIEYVGK